MNFITTLHFVEKVMNVIEKRAQIKILYHIMDRFCNSELSETGRKAVKSLIANLNKEIDDISRIEKLTHNDHRYCDS